MSTAPATRHSSGGFLGLSNSYLIFLTGLTVSKLGDSLYALALPWIAYDLTGSPVIMGTLFATEILPTLLFGAFAGVYVDRWDRRKLMLWADAIRAALVALIPLFHLLGLLQVWHLYLVAFGLALLTLVFDVTTTAVTPELAGANLTQANAAYQLVNQGADMASPALAGLVIAMIGGFQTLWLDVISFGGTFFVLLWLPGFKRAASDKNAKSVLKGIAEGFQWLWASTEIKLLSLQAMTGNFGYGMVFAVLMYYLRSTLGLSAELSGLEFSMLGIGGVVGSILIVPLARRYRKGYLYPRMLAVGLLGLLLMATVRAWWAPGLGFGIVSACNIGWVVLTTSVRQEMIPSQLMGRVLSFTRVLSNTAMPLGATLGGILMAHFDPSVIFMIAAAAKGTEVLIARFSAIHDLV